MENVENKAYKKEEAQRICMPVVNKTQTWPEPKTPNLLPIAPYTYYYQPQQYLQQFTPYYYNLITAPINYNLGYSYPSLMATKMDIEQYINYELKRQQSLMKEKQQQQQQQNPPARSALAPLQLQSLERQLAPQVKPIERQMTPQVQPIGRQVAPKEKRILNVQVMAMATNPRDRRPAVEPLPPVEDAFRERVAKIDKSQQHYTQLFGRLTSMLQTLNRRYDGHEPEPESEPEPDTEAEAEQECEIAPAPPSKRPRHESCSSSESQLDVETALSHYPQRLKLEDGSAVYVLGPNGTRISGQQYGQIFWTDAPVATRCLLAAVFSSDELATHTLTGKPSPAFYGRERPAKKMLDQRRVDDIVVSVRNRTGGKERNIRATITTKCADTAKKYKRRAKKASKAHMIVIDE
ncbi:early boundary activity protein 2 [Drosophila innubila]|uniref:early boundary activity protein 2 n=1 Tax=Drosophila innubila TaxID=198719 RepID=UPI00148C78A9|nr:early boundary activity protein 2 [Drosophila innubila]